MPKIPGINHLQAVRAFERLGFTVVRQSKHIVMRRGMQRLIIPRGNPINAITMAGIARAAGLTPDEFRQLL